MNPLPGKGRLIEEDPPKEETMTLPGKGRELIEPPKEETWGDYGKRLLAQGLSSVAERTIGLPGDIKSALDYGIRSTYENFSFGLPETKPGTSTLEIITTPQKQRDTPKWLNEYLQSTTQLPTSGSIEKKISKLTGGYTEPKTWFEEKFKNFIGDMSDLFSGEAFLRSGARMSLRRKALVSAGSELAGDVVEATTGEKSDKYKAKAASTALLTLLNPRGARRYVSGLYDTIRDSIPAGQQVSVNQYVPRFQNFINRTMRSGVATESTRPVIRDAEAIIEMLQRNNGRVDMHALLDLKQRVNENRSRFHTTAITGMERRTGRELYRNLMQNIDSMLENGLNQIPDVHAHDLVEMNRGANQAWSTLHDVENSSRILSRNLPKSMKGSALGAFLEEGFRHPSFALKTAGAAAAGLGIMSGARVAMQIASSPTLRRYYAGALRAAARNDSKLITTMLSKLEEEWKKQEDQKSQ